ncbi:Hexokinase [Fusarium oxysporum f. sp. albedinis]|nr:Hexokinase [Fusarium oxysporum f. sp. albedinis]
MSYQLVSPDAAVSKPQQVGGVCAQSFQRITSPDLSSVRFILKLDAATCLSRKMDERPVTTSANDSVATLQPLLDTQPTSSASSPLGPTEKPDTASKKQSKSTSKWLQFLTQWGLEITALALSLIAFGLMIYLLYQSAGEPISKWTKTHISLNTAHVSQGKWNWLSRSAQPLVDFDRFNTASRGAWGSLRLLQSCVRRPRWIAIGALTAIALLTFEPFTQAVLVIRDKEVILDHREYNKVVQSSNGSLETHGNVPTIGQSTRLDGASWTRAFAGVGLV